MEELNKKCTNCTCNTDTAQCEKCTGDCGEGKQCCEEGMDTKQCENCKDGNCQCSA